MSPSKDSTTNIRPVLVSQSLVVKLTRDPNFFSQFPEFGVLKSNPKPTSSCRSCKKQRAQNKSTATFLRILQSLSPEQLKKFKALAGAERLQFNAHNPVTGAHEVVVI